MSTRLRKIGAALTSAASALATVVALAGPAAAGPAAPADCSAKTYYLTLNGKLLCSDALDNSWALSGIGTTVNASAYNAIDG